MAAEEVEVSMGKIEDMGSSTRDNASAIADQLGAETSTRVVARRPFYLTIMEGLEKELKDLEDEPRQEFRKEHALISTICESIRKTLQELQSVYGRVSKSGVTPTSAINAVFLYLRIRLLQGQVAEVKLVPTGWTKAVLIRRNFERIWMVIGDLELKHCRQLVKEDDTGFIQAALERIRKALRDTQNQPWTLETEQVEITMFQGESTRLESFQDEGTTSEPLKVDTATRALKHPVVPLPQEKPYVFEADEESHSHSNAIEK